MQDFITIVQTVGFPIACATAMFILLHQEQKSHKEESEKLTETINELKLTFNSSIADESRKTTEAINNNTLVMQKLIDKLEGDNKNENR